MAELTVGGAKSDELKTPYTDFGGATSTISSNVRIS